MADTARIKQRFESARKAINQPEIRFHELRHTYASWLVKDPNIPLTAMRDLLGHSSLAVTSKYAHLRNDTLVMVANTLKGAQKGAQGESGDAAKDAEKTP